MRGPDGLLMFPNAEDDFHEQRYARREAVALVVTRLMSLGWTVRYAGPVDTYTATMLHRKITVHGSPDSVTFEDANHPSQTVLAMDWDRLEARRAIETPRRKWRRRKRPESAGPLLVDSPMTDQEWRDWLDRTFGSGPK